MRQLWTQAAVIALTAGTLGASANAAPFAGAAGQRFTPNFPINQPAAQPTTSQPAQGAPETVQTAPGDVETLPKPQPIQSQLLAPVTSADAPVASPVSAAAPPPAAQPVAAPVLRPVAPRTVVTTTVTGPVVEVAGKPQVRTVESGDALDAIARGMGTTRAELAEINGLKAPYALKLGQKIKGPAGTQKAYSVQTGDTMFAIAKRFSVTAAALAEENGLKSGAAIKKGQKLLLPEGFKDKGPIKTTQIIPGTPTSQVAETEPAPTRPAAVTPSRPLTTTAARPPIGATSAAEPTTVSTTSLSVTGSVVTVAGPRQVHTVKSGDTLTAIARKFDMSVSDLADDNKLDSGKTLRPGQKVRGPATTAKAYVAQSGDTLGDIAKRFNVSVKALAAENNLRSTASIKKGQKIQLPDGYKDKGPIRTTTTVSKPPAAQPSNTYARVETPAPAPTTTRPPAATSTPSAATPSSPIPYAQTNPRPSAPVAAQPITPPPSSRPLVETSAAPTEAEIIASGKGKFAWPVRGDVISSFGVKGTGQRNDGLNIRAPQGTPVLSAADGEVAYAGNQVPTFGNLVLVKHADGWVTAYAHLSSTNVKMRQQVRQGEQLGAVGATGGVNEPQLHFEMRYAPTAKDKAKPVDPNLVLPR